MTTLSEDNGRCNLRHDRAVIGTIKVIVASNVANRPGRPSVREYRVCRSHAKQLRSLGFDLARA